MAILRWCQEKRVGWHYTAPGKPQQNAFIESFIGTLRDECHCQLHAVCLGSFLDELLTINNSGRCPLLISSIAGSSDFLPPSVLSYPLLLGSGDSVDVVVRFQPTTFGSGAITIISNDPAASFLIEKAASSRAKLRKYVITQRREARP